MALAARAGVSSQPAISICIANYNGLAVIDDCIRSVLGQQDAPEVEIIVHDDASTDGSGAYIRRTYPHVKYIGSPQNVGFCVANNRMVAQAGGEYILLLNNDAALLPDALATLYRSARTCGMHAILSLPQYDFESGALLDRGCRLDPFLNPVPNLDPSRKDVGMVLGACLWIPKALWEEMGGFPEWFGSVGEDLYLCCRARLAGYPVRVPARSGYLHRVGQSFGGGKVRGGRLVTTKRRRTLSERNKTFVLVICYPAPFMQLMLPLHLVLLLLEGLALSLLKPSSRCLREIYLPVFGALMQRGHEICMARCNAMSGRRLAAGKFFSAIDWVPYKLRMLLRHGLPRVR